MSQLIFAHAKTILNKAEKEINKIKETYLEMGEIVPDEIIEKIYEDRMNIERKRFNKILSIAQVLHNDYVEFTGKTTSNHYFITIRPKPKTNFQEFYSKVKKFIERSCIISYNLTFEQKSPEGTGEGFHVHIVANTKHRSKGECLRDTTSTFKNMCEPQCIQIKPTREPEKIINNYLLEYKSDDGHKEVTKNGDNSWRANNNLHELYNNENPL